MRNLLWICIRFLELRQGFSLAEPFSVTLHFFVVVADLFFFVIQDNYKSHTCQHTLETAMGAEDFWESQ